MASPSAAGNGALLMQHFANETGDFPNAATLKTLMINGARDLGRAGPDYEFGWGIIDSQQAAELITGGAYTEGVIPWGQGAKQRSDCTLVRVRRS